MGFVIPEYDDVVAKKKQEEMEYSYEFGDNQKGKLNSTDLFSRPTENTIKEGPAKKDTSKMQEWDTEKQKPTAAANPAEASPAFTTAEKAKKPEEKKIQDTISQQQKEIKRDASSKNEYHDESLFSRLRESETKETINDARTSVKQVFKALKNWTAPLLKNINSKAKAKVYDLKFRNSKSATAAGYKFRINDDTVMVSEYVGSNTELRMPNTVLHKPVVYVSPKFLVGSQAEVENVRLPKYLEILPDNIFRNCNNLKTIIVPPTLKMFCKNALRGSTPAFLVFVGECPEGLADAFIPRRTKILCYPQYKSSFKGIVGVTVLKQK